MNALVLAVACLTLLLLAGCGEDAQPNAADEASVAERTLQPDHAPTPFSAAEIRAGCPAGREVTWRVNKDGAEPFLHTFRFLASTPENMTFVVSVEGGANPAQTSPPIVRPWKEVQAHASFPKDQTVITEAAIDTEVGTQDCWLYTVTVPGEQQGSEEVKQYWFGKDRPGPPMRMIYTLDGIETYRQMLVSDEIKPLPADDG